MTQLCRICLQQEDVQLLIQPCQCSGSIQYVHSACLHTWLKQRFRRQYRLLLSSTEVMRATGLICELCRTEYAGQRLGIGWRRALRVVFTSGTSVRLAINGVILTYLLYRIATILLEILLDAHQRKAVIHRLPGFLERLRGYGGLWVRMWVNTSALLLFASALRVFAGDVLTLGKLLVGECTEFRISNIERR